MEAVLDATSIAVVRHRLEGRQTEPTTLLEAGRRSDQSVSPDKAIGRLTRQDALQQQQMSAELMRRHEQELARVRQALQGIDAGTYGACRRCSEPIGLGRLNAMPHASLCVRCANQKPSRRR